MIPLPPPDRALPNLPAMLDKDLMRERLDRWFPGLSEPVARSRPTYVRYKQGTSCVVRYDIPVKATPEPFDASSRAPLSITAYPEPRTRFIAARPSFTRLAERAALRSDDGPLPWAVADYQLSALFTRFPVDRALRPLVRAFDLRVIRKHPGMRHVQRVEIVRYKPGRRAVLRYEGHGLRSFFGRLYADGRGPRIASIWSALARLGAPVGEAPFMLQELDVLVSPEVPGKMPPGRGASDRPAALAAGSRALAALHETPISEFEGDALTALAVFDSASVLSSAASAVGVLRPDLGPRAFSLSRRLSERIQDAGSGSSRTVISHGDFYDDQFIVGPDGARLIDLDSACAAPPELDVSNMLAHLAIEGEHVEREAFLDAYRPTRALRAGLNAFEAAALLRLSVAPFRRLEPDWPNRLERIMELAEARLDHRQPRLRKRDERLPLEVLLDRHAMRPILQSACAESEMSIEAATLIRHRPGRRCVIKYDVVCGDEPRRRCGTVYGKAFTGGRHSRVAAVHAAIAESGACGGAARLAELIDHVPELGLVLFRGIPGRPAEVTLRSGDMAFARRLADAIHELHSSGLCLPRRHSLDAELSVLDARIADLLSTDPPLGTEAETILERVRGEFDGLGTIWRSCPVHRDFYHDQVVDAEGVPGLLDFDDAKRSDPAIDVANFLAHLDLLALQHPEDAAAIELTCLAFERQAIRNDGDLDRRLVDLLRAATALRLAAIHRPRQSGEDLARGMLMAADAALQRATSPEYRALPVVC